MTRELNLNDIQGNVTRAYGRFSFPFARYYFFHIDNAAAGRKFIDEVRKLVTTAERWAPEPAKGEDHVPGVNYKPKVTTNMAFTFLGLWALELPVRTLQGMPDVFAEGMKARAFVLGDRDQTLTEEEAAKDNWCAHWDPIWQKNRVPGAGGKDDVHIWLSLNAQCVPGTVQPVPELEHRVNQIKALLGNGVRLMEGNSQTGPGECQEASAVFEDFGGLKVPSPKEHFGFTDGIGDPVFEGQYNDAQMKTAVIGRGKMMGNGWEPLATGEFILGHPDESQELPPTSRPAEFMHNGTYMAYRKLHENVGTFWDVVDAEVAQYCKVMDVDEDEGRETLLAKMCGRWTDGVPLSVVPTYAEWQAFRAKMNFVPTPQKDIDAGKVSKEDAVSPFDAYMNQIKYIKSPEASDFRYADDMAGLKCPVGAHMRRVNTRDYMDPMNKFGVGADGTQPENPDANTALNKRRRVLRRGLPYGPPNFDSKDDDTEQGVAMMLLGTSLFRQFEFVQQQWIQYGLDFHQGNNTDPLLGNHDHHKRHTIPSCPMTGKPPYVMSKLKTFVECRGGDYFFIPSMTALRMLGMGIVDPT